MTVASKVSMDKTVESKQGSFIGNDIADNSVTLIILVRDGRGARAQLRQSPSSEAVLAVRQQPVQGDSQAVVTQGSGPTRDDALQHS
jgi:hypothetical protein